MATPLPDTPATCAVCVDVFDLDDLTRFYDAGVSVHVCPRCVEFAVLEMVSFAMNRRNTASRIAASAGLMTMPNRAPEGHRF